MPYLIVWVVLSALVGVLSDRRGAGFVLGFVSSLFLSPLIGLLITVASNKGTRVCPACAERVKEAATMCRYCHSALPAVPVPAPSASPEPRAATAPASLATPEPPAPKRKIPRYMPVGLGVGGVALLAWLYWPEPPEPAGRPCNALSDGNAYTQCSDSERCITDALIASYPMLAGSRGQCKPNQWWLKVTAGHEPVPAKKDDPHRIVTPAELQQKLDELRRRDELRGR